MFRVVVHVSADSPSVVRHSWLYQRLLMVAIFALTEWWELECGYMYMYMYLSMCVCFLS